MSIASNRDIAPLVGAAVGARVRSKVVFFIRPALGSDFQGLIPNARPEFHCDEMLSAWVCNQGLAAYLGAEAFGASRSARSLRKAVLSDARQTLMLGFPGSSRVKPLSSTSRCMD